MKLLMATRGASCLLSNPHQLRPRQYRDAARGIVGEMVRQPGGGALGVPALRAVEGDGGGVGPRLGPVQGAVEIPRLLVRLTG